MKLEIGDLKATILKSDVTGNMCLHLENNVGYCLTSLSEKEAECLLFLTSKLQEWQDIVAADSAAKEEADV